MVVVMMLLGQSQMRNNWNDTHKSPAAGYDQRVLNKIRKALDKQPDVDLTTVIPYTYSKMLQSRLKVEKGKQFLTS